MFSYRVLNYTKTKKKQQPPSNEIWYWSPLKLIIDSNWIPESLEGQGGLGEVNVVSHTFEKGKGVITCDEDIITITNNAFTGSSITKVHLPEGLQTISYAAFANCSNLKEVSFPKSIVSIIQGAFLSCNLEEIDLSDCINLTTLDGNCFDGNNNVEYINLQNCENLSTFNTGLTSNLNRLKRINFKNCKNLTTISNGFCEHSSVEQLDFKGCESLEIVDTCFNYCNNLKYINFGQSLNLTSISDSFNYCSNLKLFDIKGNELVISNSFNNCGFNKIEIDNKSGIKSISDSFCECDKLKIISINCEILTLLSSSFSNCLAENVSLKNCINLTENSYGIGGYNNFMNCRMKELTIDNCGFDKFFKIDTNYFNYLKVLNLRNYNSFIIGSGLFHLCNSLSTVNFQNCRNLTINTASFLECSNLVNVNITNSKITTLGSAAFKDCTSLRSIDLSLQDELTVIESVVFLNCNSLKTIKFNKNLQQIGSAVFDGCTSLKKLVFEKLISFNMSLGSAAIQNSGVEYVSFKNSNITSYNSSFFVNSNIKILDFENSTIPYIEYGSGSSFFAKLEKLNLRNCSNLQRIYSVFTLCPNLKEINFSGCTNLQRIENDAFNISNIRKLDFRGCSSLIRIYDSFGDCYNLKEIQFNKELLKIENSFINTTSLYKISFQNNSESELREIYYSFSGCNFKKLYFDKMNYLSNVYNSFTSCRKLEYIDFSYSLNLDSDSNNYYYPYLQVNSSFNTCNLKYIDFSNTKKVRLSYGFNNFTETDPKTGNTIGNRFILNLENSGIERLEDLYTTCVDSINLRNCKDLTYVSGFNGAVLLKDINFEGCSSLTYISGFNGNSSIENINLKGCSSLNTISGAFLASENNKLSTLDFSDCSNLSILNSFLNFKNLNNINFDNTVSISGSFSPHSEDSAIIDTLYIPSSLTLIYSCFSGANINHIIVDENNEVYDSRNNCDCVVSTETGTIVLGCSNSIIPTEGDISIHTRAFAEISIPDLIIPSNVVGIETEGFYLCKINTITVENGNQHYDSRNNCNAIIETETNTLIKGCDITIIPDDVTNIGDKAFQNCTSLTSIVIPDSVTSIGHNAFDNCSNLSSVTIGSSVTSLGGYAFYGCKNLTSIIIPDTVTSIGTYAFYGCKNLNSFTFGSGVTSIPNYMLGSTAIENITIPELITTVGSSVFGYSNSILKNVTILSLTPPTGVSNLISNDSKLYVYPESLDDYRNAISSLALKSRILPINNIITYTASSKLTEVTENTDNGLHINSFNSLILSHEFSDNKGIIVFEDDITEIGNYAFYGSDASNIFIPYSVTTIGNSAFKGCSITSVFISDPITNISENAFSECDGLLEVLIPANVENIGNNAFDSCSNLLKVTIKTRNIPLIGTNIFSNEDLNRKIYVYPDLLDEFKSNLSQYTDDIISMNNVIIYTSTSKLPELNSYSSYSPGNGLHITRFDNTLISHTWNEGTGIIEFLNDVTIFKSDAFYGCSQLTSIIIPDTVTVIEEYVFKNNSIKDVYIPSNVTSIPNNAFSDCPLESIVVSENNTTYDSRDNCNAIIRTSDDTLIKGCKNTVIPSTIKIIGSSSLYQCNFENTDIVLPSGVTTINSHAFAYSNITSIVIPATVTTMTGLYIFMNCSNLSSITCLRTSAPSIQANTFNTIKTGGILYVPAGSNYTTWMQNKNYYLGKYNWTKVELT